MAAFAHRNHFSSANSREAKNNLCIGVVRLIVEPNAVPPNDNRHSSMSSVIRTNGVQIIHSCSSNLSFIKSINFCMIGLFILHWILSNTSSSCIITE
ncbi:hypothetical protein QL285_085162 [Trifolium repens]|nr:hypothetical protein QL285_085162 [Trifolium repens]